VLLLFNFVDMMIVLVDLMWFSIPIQTDFAYPLAVQNSKQRGVKNQPRIQFRPSTQHRDETQGL
jgi:hypothetical protein